MSDSSWWVERADGENIGDYGGFTFGTREEAIAFIETEYEEEQRLIDTGYYEAHHEIPVLVLERHLVTTRQEIPPPPKRTS